MFECFLLGIFPLCMELCLFDHLYGKMHMREHIGSIFEFFERKSGCEQDIDTNRLERGDIFMCSG